MFNQPKINPQEHPWSEEDCHNFVLWIQSLGGNATILEMDMKGFAAFDIDAPKGRKNPDLMVEFDSLRFDWRKGIVH
jgi:hypothetical protein